MRLPAASAIAPYGAMAGCSAHLAANDAGEHSSAGRHRNDGLAGVGGVVVFILAVMLAVNLLAVTQ